MRKGRLRRAIPEKLGVEVGVRINEARCDDLAGCVDFLVSGFSNLANLGDTIALDGDVGLIAWQAGAIDDSAIADNEIIHGAFPSGLVLYR